MTTYAIADLHGRHDLLMDALYAIRDDDFDKGKPGGTIITLGDYVDRGPDSKKIIETLMTGLDPIFGEDSGFELVSLKGNHEAMMLQVCSTGGLIDWWMGNGGGHTLLSFGHPSEGNVNVGIVPQDVLRWIKDLPLYHEDDNRVFVHAGVGQGIPLDEQDEETFTWMLYPDDAEGGYDGKHVVHGHHQFEDGPKMYDGRTDLDTMAWYTGRLVIGVFADSLPGGPSATIEVQGQTYHELRDQQQVSA